MFTATRTDGRYSLFDDFDCLSQNLRNKIKEYQVKLSDLFDLLLLNSIFKSSFSFFFYSKHSCHPSRQVRRNLIHTLETKKRKQNKLTSTMKRLLYPFYILYKDLNLDEMNHLLMICDLK